MKGKGETPSYALAPSPAAPGHGAFAPARTKLPAVADPAIISLSSGPSTIHRVDSRRFEETWFVVETILA
jgi:hypothetical protein